MLSISRHYRPVLVEFIERKHPEFLEHLDSSEMVSKETARRIRKAVEAELLDEGFGKDSEPTSYGLALESIIDEINKNHIH